MLCLFLFFVMSGFFFLLLLWVGLFVVLFFVLVVCVGVGLFFGVVLFSWVVVYDGVACWGCLGFWVGCVLVCTVACLGFYWFLFCWWVFLFLWLGVGDCCLGLGLGVLVFWVCGVGVVFCIYLVVMWCVWFFVLVVC